VVFVRCRSCRLFNRLLYATSIFEGSAYLCWRSIGIAGGVATAVVIGLLLGEELSYAKLAGIVLVVIGGIVLVAYK
jgi:multidrug transporter EmrE-like cation transporter